MNLVAEIQSLLDAYGAAYAAHDAERCAGFYAEDGEIHMPGGPPIVGRPAIAEAHADWFTQREENKTLVIDKVGASGDLAYCTLTYSADILQDGAPPMRDAGSSLNTLRRQPDGSLRMHITALMPSPD